MTTRNTAGAIEADFSALYAAWPDDCEANYLEALSCKAQERRLIARVQHLAKTDSLGARMIAAKYQHPLDPWL